MAKLYYPLALDQVSEWPGDRGGWWHYGTDFAVPVNTPLKASFDGEVVFAGGDGASGQINGVWANGEGLTVDILRADGLRARYGHLNRIDVHIGQKVKAGQVIGLSGNTGYTTGPHCHWELRWDSAWSGGAWVDPRKLGAKPLPTPRKKGFLEMAKHIGPFNHIAKQVIPGDWKWRSLRVKTGRSYLVAGPAAFTGNVILDIDGLTGGTVQARIIRAGFRSRKALARGRTLSLEVLEGREGSAYIMLPFTGKTNRVYKKGYKTRIYIDIRHNQDTPITVSKVRAEGLKA